MSGNHALLSNEVAVVTGAASGIGKEIAQVFARHGAHVLAFDRDSKAGIDLIESLDEGSTGRHRFFEGDVGDADDVARAVDAMVEFAGAIQVLVNCAGTRETQDFFDMTAGEWARIVSVNLNGVFNFCQAAARRMRDNGGGRIVNIASVAGLVGVPHRPAYTTTKHGVIGLTRSLALDLAKAKIRVNAICPGVIRTPLTEHYYAHEQFQRDLAVTVPQGRNGETSEVAHATLFLASEMSSYITGVALPVDGGFLSSKSFLISDLPPDFYMEGEVRT